MEVGNISVTTDAGQVVMTFVDHAYPDRPLRWRISDHEAAQLSSLLAAAADSINQT